MRLALGCYLALGIDAFVAFTSRSPHVSDAVSLGRERGGAIPTTASETLLVRSAFVAAPVSKRKLAGGNSPRPKSRAAGGRVRQTTPPRMVTLEVVEDSEIPAMVEFFVSNFWEEDISPGQRRPLVRELTQDYRRRYGSLVGRRNLPSMFVAAKKEGEILGCVAIEVSVCLGERVGLKARGVSVFNPDAELRPVLANLAVSRSARRKGLAQRLVKRCEDAAKEWGYGEVLLLVEENNERARRLYKKLGYKILFKDRDAKKVIPLNNTIRDVPCVNVCMRRELKANIFSGLLRLVGQQ